MRLSSILQTPASLLCDAMTGDLDAFSGADNKNQVVTCFARSLDIRQKSSRAGPDLTGMLEVLKIKGGTKAQLLLLKLIHLFATDILLVKKLEIEKTKTTFVISVLKVVY